MERLAHRLVTPAHIVPEWYFLPFYAILRAVPSKLGGVGKAGGRAPDQVVLAPSAFRRTIDDGSALGRVSMQIDELSRRAI